jgi:hypothetical protein
VSYLDLPGSYHDGSTANGFQWGGRWSSRKDYMHFSSTNR